MKYNTDSKFPIKMWTDFVPVEAVALQQLKSIANLPFIYKHIAVMPDVHWGMGATVGSVIATKGAVCPAAVGVDIGCGMMAVKTNIAASQLPENLHAIRCDIEKAVPHGRTNNGGSGDRGAWRDVPPSTYGAWVSLFDGRYRHITPEMVQSAKIQNFAWSETLTRIPKDEWPAAALAMRNPPKEVWRSRRYLLQVYKEPDGIERLSICTTDVNDGQRWVDGIAWDDLQSLKNQCGRGDKLAVEVYPKDADIVNVANMRHLWVLKDDLKFVWRKK